AGVEESGHSVVGRHSSILVLNRESETDPVGKLPGAPSERGRRPVGAGKLPRVPEDYRKFGAGTLWPSIVTVVSIFSSSSAAFACDFRARISMERLTRRPLILYPVCTPYMREGSLLMARISVGPSSPWKRQYSPRSSAPVLSGSAGESCAEKLYRRFASTSCCALLPYSSAQRARTTSESVLSVPRVKTWSLLVLPLPSVQSSPRAKLT